MSYEHCNIHDCDATNGCPTCTELEAATEAQEAVESLVRDFEAKYDPDERATDAFTELAVTCYRLGKGA